MKTIATIELDNNKGLGQIYAKLEDSNDGKAYVIYVALPDGTTEEPSISPQKTIKDVHVAISAAWGQGWNLDWN